MALPMPRPFKSTSGAYYVNIRVPSDLAAQLRGKSVHLPVGPESVCARISDKVQVSLKTKNPNLAKERFAAARDALERFWENTRLGPVTLKKSEAVAVAGAVYRDVKSAVDQEVVSDEEIKAIEAAYEKRVQEVMAATGYERAWAESEVDEEFGPEFVAAGALNDDAAPDFIRMGAAESLFGDAVDQTLGDHQLSVDKASRDTVIEHLAERTWTHIGDHARRIDEGDYGPDPADLKYPPIETLPRGKASAKGPQNGKPGTLTAIQLYEIWAAGRKGKVADSTIRRYSAAWSSLDRFWKKRDIRLMTNDDIWDWAKTRENVDKIAAKTVNRNDLVAVRAVFNWAKTPLGNRTVENNPATGVKLDEDRVPTAREKTFRVDEIRKILTAARCVKLDDSQARRHPSAAFARRWVPWLSAYTGQRVQDLVRLEKADIRQEGSVWVFDLKIMKTSDAHLVPIHRDIISEGFLKAVQQCKDGPLFVDAKAKRQKSLRSQSESRAAALAEWVSHIAGLPAGVSPNHGWRHTFKTRAIGDGITEAVSDAITGHKPRRVAGRYVTPPLSFLVEAMERFSGYLYELNQK